MKNQLPKSDSIRELAEFWDTHDVTEFEDELEEFAEPAFVRANEITVRLESSEASAIHEMARSRGVQDWELIREWVLERIHAG